MQTTTGSKAENGALSRYVGATDRPVFVGACPRSGTTLLRTMLNCHPDLAIPRETRILIEAWERRDQFGDPSVAANRRKLGRWVFRRKASWADRLDVEKRAAIKRLVQAPPTFGSLIGTCFQMFADAHDKPRWGDKRPSYARYLDAVFAMFPDAQYINVVRDPRATVASMRKLGWFDGNIAHGTEMWERSIRSVESWRKRLAQDQFLDVRYEDLVSDPAAVLERIVLFLGLPEGSADKMLAYYEQVDVPDNAYHWRVSQPVTADAVRSWEQTLSGEEIALVEQATRKAMAQFGYEPAMHGTRVPHDLQRELLRRRMEKAKMRLDNRAREAKFRFTYRYPVAARLTHGQRG